MLSARVKAVWWGSIAAAVLGSVTLGWFAQLMWRTWRWDPREDCAAGALPWEEIGVAADVFPPQLTCVGGDRVTFANPLWTGQLLVVGVTVVIICALVSRWYRQGAGGQAAGRGDCDLCCGRCTGCCGCDRGRAGRGSRALARTSRRLCRSLGCPPAPTASSTPAAPASAAKARAALHRAGPQCQACRRRRTRCGRSGR